MLARLDFCIGLYLHKRPKLIPWPIKNYWVCRLFRFSPEPHWCWCGLFSLFSEKRLNLIVCFSSEYYLGVWLQCLLFIPVYSAVRAFPIWACILILIRSVRHLPKPCTQSCRPRVASALNWRKRSDPSWLVVAVADTGRRQHTRTCLYISTSINR